MSKNRPSSAPQLFVLGGGYAGVMAANRLRAHLPQADVTLIDDTGTFAHRIRLHEYGAGRPLSAPSLKGYLHPRVHLQVARVSTIDASAESVDVLTSEGSTERLSYDGLVYALGSGYGGITFPGLFTHAFPLGHWAGADAIRGALTSTLSLAIQGGKISGVYITRNPDKLSHLPQALPTPP